MHREANVVFKHWALMVLPQILKNPKYVQRPTGSHSFVCEGSGFWL